MSSINASPSIGVANELLDLCVLQSALSETIGKTTMMPRPVQSIIAEYVCPTTLAVALLSEKLIKEIMQGNEEKTVISIIKLILNVGKKAIVALNKGQLTAFDAFVGDFGCELRALKIYDLTFSNNLKKEATELSKKFIALREALNKRNADLQTRNGNKVRAMASPAQFFQTQLCGEIISLDMTYLMQAFMLTQTKECEIKEGIKRERTDFSKFQGSIPKEIRYKIVSYAQTSLSIRSMDYVSAQASLISSLAWREKAVLNEMLAPAARRLFDNKIVGCGFYKMKAIGVRLQEKGSLVAVKKMARKNEKTFCIFYRSPAPREPFKRIVALKTISKSEPVIVFEGAVAAKISCEELAIQIEKIGLLQLILANATQKSPYEQDTTLDDIPLQEAREEVRRYTALSQTIGCEKGRNPLFMLDHVYTSLWLKFPI